MAGADGQIKTTTAMMQPARHASEHRSFHVVAGIAGFLLFRYGMQEEISHLSGLLATIRYHDVTPQKPDGQLVKANFLSADPLQNAID